MQQKIAKIAELDASGLLIGPEESFDGYIARVSAIVSAHRQFEEILTDQGQVTVFEGIKVKSADRIDDEIAAEAAQVTDELYAFRVDYVPGFFLSGEVGLLWGGCLIADNETHLSVFLIRSIFKKKAKWLFYNRRELMAHELCHAAHQILEDCRTEEYFAYQTSPSRLRRYLGNCFIHSYDAVLFVIPPMILLLAQVLQFAWLPRLPVWPFWLLAAIYPLFLFVRNQLSRNRILRAKRNLTQLGLTQTSAVLFRLTGTEIAEIARLREPAALTLYLDNKQTSNLRWQVIAHRFMRKSDDETIS